jgi:hypothetical protein
MPAARWETPEEDHIDQEDDGEQVERTLRTLDPTTTGRCQDFWLDGSHIRIVRRCASTRTAAAPKTGGLGMPTVTQECGTDAVSNWSWAASREHQCQGQLDDVVLSTSPLISVCPSTASPTTKTIGRVR